jgi:hypothetical protein
MHQAHTQLSARILLELQDIAIANTKAEQHGHDSMCVYAKLRRIEIVGSDGSVISSIDGASLPTGPAAPAMITSAPPAGRPVRDTRSWSDEMHERAQENLRRGQESQAASHERAQARAHDLRIRNCALFASHRFPDTSSPEYQKANDDCVQRVTASERKQQ